MEKHEIKKDLKESSMELDDFQKIDSSGNLYKQIFRYSIVPTIIHDLDMNILKVNDSAIEQFGYSRSEFLKISVFDLHTASELEHSEEVLGKMQDEDKLRVETYFQRKDGSEFAAQVTPCKFMFDGKPVIHVFIQDITHRKQRENQLKKLNSALKKEVKKVQKHTEELERKNDELAQFAYIASHDLQEPLRTVTNFVQLLDKKYKNELDETADTYLNFILKATKRMRDLIKGLLEYSHIGHEDEVSEVDLNRTIELVKKDLNAVIHSSNVSFEIDEMPIVNGYETELRMLFQNLISNAIKFHKEGQKPFVKISVDENDECWIFTVKDNGIGIRPEYREKIFIIFQRLNDQVDFKGSGIGLAHCKKIVELHDGSIRVESELGKGSSFIIQIPKQ